MRYTNVRTFIGNFFSEIKDLPVTITRYGIPIAEVNSVGEVIKEVSNIPYVEEEPDLNRIQMCGIQFCKSVGKHRIKFENPETFEREEKVVCEEHFTKLKKMYEVEEC